MKKYNYSVSTSVLWTSFDYGEVEADTIEEARAIAIRELNYDFKKANDALSYCDNTIGFSVSFDEQSVVINEVI
jgi:hypothetical protein